MRAIGISLSDQSAMQNFRCSQTKARSPRHDCHHTWQRPVQIATATKLATRKHNIPNKLFRYSTQLGAATGCQVAIRKLALEFALPAYSAIQTHRISNTMKSIRQLFPVWMEKGSTFE
ncbi:MAG TPA: hypothetical protein PLU47_16140 [Azonexus sp.]|nr:hypothetical protein [Azonexus sp.]